MICLFAFLLMMFTFLLSKIAMHPLLQNMPIERSALFLGQGKCALVVLQRGGCPEVVERCVRENDVSVWHANA